MAKRVKYGKAYNIGQGMVHIVGNNPNITDGVSIGANTPDNLQVNNNEVLVGAEASKSGKTLYPTSNSIKVLSAEPMLGGISPVQLLYWGMAPDKVFAIQEQYKDIHRINDDGSKYQKGGETKKRAAIAYGDKTSTRLRYLNLDKKLVAYINHVAKQYNISPAVLASRLSSEGVVDKHIQYLDGNRDKDGTSLLEHIYNSGYGDYGLDDTFSLYKKGKLNLRRKIPFQKTINANEHNRIINSVMVRDPYDGIELMAANLEYFGKEIKKKFPNLKDKDLDTAIAKAYNMGLYGAINDISKNGVGNKYKINDGYYNINYNNDIYLQNKDKVYNINKFTIDEQNSEIDDWTDVYSSNVDYAKEHDNAQIYPTEDFKKEWARKHAIKTLTEGDYEYAYPIGTTDYTYNNPFANVDFSFKFGGQTKINSLGERPNAKFEKEMKNKRNKAKYGLNQPFYPTYIDGPLVGLRIPQNTLNTPAFPTDFTPKSTIGQIDPFMGVKPSSTILKTTPVSNGIETTPKSFNWSNVVTPFINVAGSLIAAGINQNAINKQTFTPRKAVLLNPVKLKTKININPQLAKMREMQAQLADAARRTSGSSREAYRRILAGHNRTLESAMDLYGRQENMETERINQDRLNQQNIAAQNAQNVINTVNTNIAGKDDVNNRKSMLTAQNWINPVNVIAGTVAGPQGLLARRDARRSTAANLAMMSLVHPDAARMIMSGDGWQKAFNGYYDILNNKVRV